MNKPSMRRRVWDHVREMFPTIRYAESKTEIELGVHLRGNEPLYNCLKELIESRISGRASVPEPSDPNLCKSMLAKDRELQWLLGRLEYIYTSPASQEVRDQGEPPAA